jgi:hypothetical protein
MVVKSSVSLGQMIESAKLVEFDLMDIYRDEQRLCQLSFFAVVGKHSALMWHHKSVCGSVVGSVVESRSVPLVFTSGMSRRTLDSRSWTVAP